MNRKAFVFLFCFVVAVFAACKKQATSSLTAGGPDATQTPRAPEERKESGLAKFDVCGLITKEEIQAVQGSPIKEIKGSEHAGAFRVSQCVYVAEDFVKSVSVAVTQSKPDSQTKRTPKDLWHETFGRSTSEEEKPDKEKQGADVEQGRGQEKEKKRPPKKIDGLGNEACWTSGVTSALYALKNDAFIRISIGGPDNEEIKLNKSRELMEKALARL